MQRDYRDAPATSDHCCRSATIGSTRAARLADFFVLRGSVYRAIAIALLIVTKGDLGLEREAVA